MSDTENLVAVDGFQREWVILQNQYEQYERYALGIKLLAVTLCFWGFTSSISYLAVIFIVLVLWLQEAVWKTFQGRTENRLMELEARIDGQSYGAEVAFQVHRKWSITKGGNQDLIAEYMASAKRPTVMFPYVPLIGLVFLAMIF